MSSEFRKSFSSRAFASHRDWSTSHAPERAATWFFDCGIDGKNATCGRSLDDVTGFEGVGGSFHTFTGDPHMAA